MIASALKALFFLFLCFSFSCQNSAPEKYTIARDKSWYPLQLNSNGIQLIGFTNALVSAIASDQKIPFNILDTSWISLFQGLEEEKFPAIFSTLPINKITDAQYSFSDPIIALGPVLIVQTGASFESLNEMSGKIVGVSAFSEAPLIIQPYPSIIIQLYDQMAKALNDLIEGKIDGVLMDTLEAHALVPSQYSGILKIVTPPLNDKAIRILTIKNKNSNLIKYFNLGLTHLKASGKYDKLRTEFGI